MAVEKYLEALEELSDKARRVSSVINAGIEAGVCDTEAFEQDLTDAFYAFGVELIAVGRLRERRKIKAGKKGR